MLLVAEEDRARPGLPVPGSGRVDASVWRLLDDARVAIEEAARSLVAGPPPSLLVRLLAALLALALLAPTALAWVAGRETPHHADLAWEAAMRLPPEMRAIVERHEDAFRRGALDPDGQLDPERDVHTFYHAYEPADGGGGGVYRVELTLHEAVVALRSGDEDAAAYQLGFLTHFVTDLAMPFHTGRDAYDDPRHEEAEVAAFLHRGDYTLAPARPPARVDDVEAYMVRVAEQSAASWPALDAATPTEGEAWSPEAARIVGAGASLAVEAASDLLLTAFALADPAQPLPPKPEEVPVPWDAEDLGWPAWLPVAIALVAAALAALVPLALARKRSRSI